MTRHGLAAAAVFRLLYLFLVAWVTALSPPKAEVASRGIFVRRAFIDTPCTAILLTSAAATHPPAALAAPPFAIMAEEMGYFPVIDERTGDTVMVPAKVRRDSTNQAISLAKYLQETGARMYGAFWCPHCSRQKELFGREAWKYVTYVECSPKGYNTQFTTCIEKGVDGYPEWEFGNGISRGGEMELVDIAKISGFKKPFKADLEVGVPLLGGGTSCQ